MGPLEIVLLTLLAAALVCLMAMQTRSARRVRGRFAPREPVPLEEMWRQHYQDEGVSREAFEEVFRLVGQVLGVSPMLLRPTDRLGVELAPERGWEFDADVEELWWWLREWARRVGTRVDESAIRTMDDLVRAAGELSLQPRR